MPRTATKKQQSVIKAPTLLELRALARREPVTFCREVLNHRRMGDEPALSVDAAKSWELDRCQVDLIEGVADVWRYLDKKPTRVNHNGLNYITVRAGHGPGKTHSGGLICHVFNAAFDGRVVATAPKFDQLKSRLWSRLRAISARAEPWYQHLYQINDTSVHYYAIEQKTGQVVLNKDHGVIAETANKPENLAGHHMPYQLVLIDEASGIPESLVPTILGALSIGVVQILVMIGNATREQGYFADSHRKRETAAQFFRQHIGIHNSERMNSASTRAWAQKLIDKYGEDSPVVRVRVKGDFPGSSPNQVFAIEWVARARDRVIDPMVGDGSLPRLRVSVDCGAGGEGETVCTAAKHFDSVRVGLKQTRHSFKLETAALETADAAELLFSKFGGRKDQDDFVVDSLGVGVGAAGHLYARGYKVVMYQGGSASDNSKRWRVRRVQSYMGARDDLRDNCVVFLDSFYDDETDWDDFDGQLCSITHPPGDSVDDLITKAEMQRQGIPSPDLSDSWAMQYATQAPKIIPSGVPNEQAATVHVVRSNINAGLE